MKILIRLQVKENLIHNFHSIISKIAETSFIKNITTVLVAVYNIPVNIYKGVS